MKPIIVTGTGRCGTGFMAQFLSSAGIKCSHEGVFTMEGLPYALEQLNLRRDNTDWGWLAESSWLAVPFLSEFRQEYVIVHLVRHPKSVIESHLRLATHAPEYGPYYRWMVQYIPEIDRCRTSEEKAACWYIRLNEIVEPLADYRHRIEDDPRDILRWLGYDWNGRELFSDTTYNKRYIDIPVHFDPSVLPVQLRGTLLGMATRYGYEWSDWEPDTVEVSWFDGNYVTLDIRSGAIGGSWQLRDETGNPVCYDWQLVQFFYNQVKQVSNPTIVDVGASTGNFALLPILHPCIVHAFEPNPLARGILESNVRLINGLEPLVTIYPYALGDHDHLGILQVPVPAVHAAVATLGYPRPRDIDWRGIPVQVRRLDNIVTQADFIKIDVEGAELHVLRGAERLIKCYQPKILVEYQSLNTRQFGYEKEEIRWLLEAWGYNRFTPVGIEDLWCEVCDDDG